MRTAAFAFVIAVGCGGVGRAQVTRAPSASELSSYTPEAAVRGGASGKAVVRCDVLASGALNACAVVSEAPTGYGFGRASVVAAAKLFTAMPPQSGGQPSIDVPFSWNDPPQGR